MALHGTSKAYIVKRLKDQGETALLAAVEAGKITALTAAVELGWVHRPPRMGGSTHRAKRIQHQLRTITGDGPDLGVLQELWLGPSPSGSCFDSREALLASWEQNRDEVMRLFATNGHRPQAWWCFDAPGLGLRWPGRDCERSYLYEHGMLSEAEKATLEAEWKADFAEAQASDFTLHDGREVLTGDRARAAHYRWADVPAALLRRWQAARRRRERRSAAPSAEAAAIK
jgi:hypothetical protein